MRERIVQVLKWIHATMLLLPVIPVIYIDIQGEENSILLLLKSLLIVIPVVATSIAVQKCKSLFVYLIFSLFLSAVTVMFAWVVQPQEMGMLYVVVMALECIFVTVNRFVTKVKAVRNMREAKGDPFWRPTISTMDTPSFACLTYFVILYFLGIFFPNKDICNELFFMTAVYIFVVYIYSFLTKTKDYLKLNKQVTGLPVRRIYGIAGGMFGFFLILVFCVTLLSAVMIPMRQYVDVREWLSQEETTPMNNEMPQDNPDMQQNFMDMEELIEVFGEAKELPKWVEYFMTAICYVCIVFVIWLIIKAILNVFSDFREGMDENGDQIEQIEDEETVYFLNKRNNETEDSETRNVRKKYRRMIRKHRKDKPAVYESPREIEEKAGLLQNEEMQKLHEEYEAVRYGNSFGEN